MQENLTLLHSLISAFVVCNLKCAVKPVLSGHSKEDLKFSRQIIAECRSKILQNAPMEHSAVLLTCIELPNGFKTFVLSIYEWPLKTGFTVSIF